MNFAIQAKGGFSRRSHTWLARLAATASLLCIGTLAAGPANAAEDPAKWPTKTIRLVLPFPPGGGTDTLARIMAPKLNDLLGQAVVVDNRAGASGNIATEIVAKADPDGYTVLMGFNTALTMNPSLYKNLPFNVQRDFKPVTMLASALYVLVVNPALPVHTVQELVNLSKAKPGTLNYSSSGPGSPLHMAGELFKARTGADITHIPYKGGGPAVIGLLGGQAQLMFGSISAVMPHVKEGKLRAIAVTSLKRSDVAPDLPTLDELGLKGFNVTSWYGLLVPKNTPDAIVTKLAAAAQKVVQMPEVRDAMAKQGLELSIDTPQEFADTIKTETATWADLIKKNNIHID
ncbi:MAG TPA: tripartite tricarboxylate transporter substrate binding protein [Bordetella sp.]|jgi:tripartite-type tricarboxylate transporter receptor subunit TctC|nr:tripartite tricarboxylate transporter substrate binding protein [Bordetella sp.]